jgi:ubiquinone/menaquinone biosynthesis C-methylase UbiE
MFALSACSTGAPPHTQHAGHGQGFHKSFADAEGYARMFDSVERDVWQMPDEVLRLLDVKPGAVVADIGAGTGYFEPHLARAVGPEGHVLALDSEPKMVSHMAERLAKAGLSNVEARLVQAGDPALPQASVDRILIVNTWHHLSDRAAYALKLHAALRQGGVLAVVDFTKESDLGPPPEHRLTAEQVIAELTAAGLEAQVVAEPLPKQYVVLAGYR